METSLIWLERLVASPTGFDWRRLFDVYAPLLHKWLTRAGIVESDRDDLVQDVLVVVVRRVSEFQHTHCGSFRGWLRAILSNRLKEYYRKRTTSQCEFRLADLADPHSELAVLLDREHDEHIARQITRLVEADFSPTTWTAFRRQVLEGRSPREVAAELQLTVNAVIKAKSRVLQRLRQEYADWYPPR